MQCSKYLIFDGTPRRTEEWLNKMSEKFIGIKIESQVANNYGIVTTISHKSERENIVLDRDSYNSSKSMWMEYLHLNFDESAQISITLVVSEDDKLLELLTDPYHECLTGIAQIENFIKGINRTSLTENDKTNLELFNLTKNLVDNFLIVYGN